MTRTTRVLCCLVAAFLYIHLASCAEISDIKRLIKDLEVDYDKSVRPVKNQSAPIVVDLAFDILSIQEVDEVEQTITMSAYFGMEWTDEQMLWNPQDYGGAFIFTVDNERFWTPTLIISNTNDKYEKISSPWLSLRVAANGRAFFYPGIILKVLCPLDIRYYPWDRHACLIAVSPWGHSPAEYTLNNVTNEIGMSAFYPNGAWDLVRSTIFTRQSEYETSYIITFILERQPGYVIVNVILPVIILSFLNLMIYFIPTDSGERISFSITLLLSIAVFLTIVGDNLPKSSTPMAYLSFYLLAVLVVSNCITLSIIYSLALYHRDESETIGGCWKRVVKVMKCQCRLRRRDNRYRSQKQFGNISQQEPFDDINSSNTSTNRRKSNSDYQTRQANWKVQSRGTSVWSSHNNTVPTNGLCHGKYIYDKEDTVTITWKDVSNAFDRMCFIFFLLVIITAMAVTFGIIYVGRKEQTFDYQF